MGMPVFPECNTMDTNEDFTVPAKVHGLFGRMGDAVPVQSVRRVVNATRSQPSISIDLDLAGHLGTYDLDLIVNIRRLI